MSIKQNLCWFKELDREKERKKIDKKVNKES